MKIAAIIPSGGSSRRFGKNKLFEKINGKTVIEKTLEIFENNPQISEIIIPSSTDSIEGIDAIIKQRSFLKSKTVPGGSSRQESVYNGLQACPNCDYVLIHAGARALVTQLIVNNTINEVQKRHAVVAAMPVKDTIKKADEEGKITETPERKYLYQIQTPQAFRFEDIKKAHELFKGENATDDSYLIEKMGINVYIVTGCYKNIKITTPEDIELASILAKE